MLIGVSGIGPKGGLNILSVLSSDEVCYAVMGNDVKALSKAPGIGKKTAERIVIELKDKLDFESFLESGLSEESFGMGRRSESYDSVQNEAVQALIALGYGSADAVKAVQRVSGEDDSVESILKKALKELSFL